MLPQELEGSECDICRLQHKPVPHPSEFFSNNALHVSSLEISKMESLRSIKCRVIRDSTMRIFLLILADHLRDLLGGFILYHTIGVVDLVCRSSIQSSN